MVSERDRVVKIGKFSTIRLNENIRKLSDFQPQKLVKTLTKKRRAIFIIYLTRHSGAYIDFGET